MSYELHALMSPLWDSSIIGFTEEREKKTIRCIIETNNTLLLLQPTSDILTVKEEAGT